MKQIRKMQKIAAIAGPTASGKTKLAVELAHKHNGEIISADSRMIYKYFDIATAKPTIAERKGIPHHLIDILEPEREYSVANFADDARRLIADISSRGKLPIIAGGTGLYFKVLLDNYNLPRVAANKELRKELEELAQKSGVEAVHKILTELDPVSAERVHPNNLVRVIRSIEIIKAFNKPLSEIATKQCDMEFDVEWIGLNASDRAVLYERINSRVDEMLSKGLEQEAQKLYKKYGKLPSLVNTIGYVEMIDYFEGAANFDRTVELIKQNTRRYAKRQMSLFNAIPEINWKLS